MSEEFCHAPASLWRDAYKRLKNMIGMIGRLSKTPVAKRPGVQDNFKQEEKVP
jgi:hypothetical protein